MQKQDKTEICNIISSAHAETRRQIKGTCEIELSTKVHAETGKKKFDATQQMVENTCEIRKKKQFACKLTKQQEIEKERKQKQEKARIDQESMKKKKTSINAVNFRRSRKIQQEGSFSNTETE